MKPCARLLVLAALSAATLTGCASDDQAEPASKNTTTTLGTNTGANDLARTPGLDKR